MRQGVWTRDRAKVGSRENAASGRRFAPTLMSPLKRRPPKKLSQRGVTLEATAKRSKGINKARTRLLKWRPP